MVAQYKHPTRRDERTGDLALTKGQQVTIVRWSHLRDGWRPEVVTGTYLGRADAHIMLMVDGLRSVFDREVWSFCAE